MGCTGLEKGARIEINYMRKGEWCPATYVGNYDPIYNHRNYPRSGYIAVIWDDQPTYSDGSKRVLGVDNTKGLVRHAVQTGPPPPPSANASRTVFREALQQEVARLTTRHTPRSKAPGGLGKIRTSFRRRRLGAVPANGTIEV